MKARAQAAAKSQGDGPDQLLTSLLLESWEPRGGERATVADLAACAAYWLYDGEPYQGTACAFAGGWARYAAGLDRSPARPSQFDEESIRRLAVLGNRAAIELEWLSERMGGELNESFGHSHLHAALTGQQPARERLSALAD